jgi:transcriptional regulator with XRE-family HTH domain
MTDRLITLANMGKQVKRGTNPGFTNKIKSLLEQTGWSNGLLAAKSGLSEPFISQILNYHVGNPSAKTMQALADAFRIPVEDLQEAAGYTPKYKRSKLDDPRMLLNLMEAEEIEHLDPRDKETIEQMTDDFLRRRRIEREQKSHNTTK